ncbi:hypothetical protein Ddye_014307 [Dipteronia dyeriana]|uniref:RNase H type-1 domain-containing protein n=1 Tax=Dipteronia dyeriana TaxID=168575 RepID=A0AAD9X7N8_9ROSI|nr:hypothetical protein Ddye_014307 [Dipteronia dyeriana]
MPITHMLLNIVDCCKDSRKMKLHPSAEWLPPPVDSFIFNVDGSAMGTTGKAGIGGVLRNHYGKVLCTFLESIGIHDAITVEIDAIAKACELCASRIELADKRIVIASDSKVAVMWLSSDGMRSITHEQTIVDIRRYLRRFNTALVVHTPRVANSIANS